MILKVLSYVGVFILGSVVGMVCMALCAANGRDRDDEFYYNECDKDVLDKKDNTEE